jgi:hypothetical protein
MGNIPNITNMNSSAVTNITNMNSCSTVTNTYETLLYFTYGESFFGIIIKVDSLDFMILDIKFWGDITLLDQSTFPEYKKYKFLEKIFSTHKHFHFKQRPSRLPPIKFYSPSCMLFFYNNPKNKFLETVLPKHEISVWNKMLKQRTLFTLLSPLLCKM